MIIESTKWLLLIVILVQDETDGSISPRADVENKSADALQATRPSTEHELQHDVKYEPDDNKSEIKESEKETTEVKTAESNLREVKEIDQNSSDKTNNTTQAPIAPPRRKKKNKKQTDMTQVNAVMTSHYKFFVVELQYNFSCKA